MVDVSVIIVCMNRPDNLYPCLESLRAHSEGVSVETLVVAYMYEKTALDKARQDFPDVKFIVNDEISGFSKNNNIALRQARGRYCFVLNDDTQMLEDVLAPLVADMERLPGDAAIVSPRLLNADGSLQLLGRPAYPARNYVLQQWHLYSEPKDNVSGETPLFGEVFRTHNITGAAFLIKTDVFRELGWFDERFFFTPEDIALSTLAESKGYGVYVDAGVSLVHKWRTTASRMMEATRPAAVRGSLMHFSGFGTGRYLLLAAAVWPAEFGKRLKAWAVSVVSPSKENLSTLRVHRNITRSIFTRRTPEQIFKKYYRKLQGK